MKLFDITGLPLERKYPDIEHWGIKGQKWGVRRYQNLDGSLTELGKKRYLRGGELTRQGARKIDVNKYNKNKEEKAKAEERLNTLARSIPNATREGSYVVVKSSYRGKTSRVQFDADVSPDRAKKIARESNKIFGTMVSELKRIVEENPDQKDYIQDLSDGKTADEIFDNLNEYHINALSDGWGLVFSAPSNDLGHWITIETDDEGRTRQKYLQLDG